MLDVAVMCPPWIVVSNTSIFCLIDPFSQFQWIWYLC